MTILDKIIAHKRLEVAEQQVKVPVGDLEKGPYFERPTFSLSTAICRPDKVGIIAEHKRKSPSKGIINTNVTVEEVTTGYVHAGASALSVLTDEQFFGGKNEDLTIARGLNEVPILRKDFTIGEYQILEAKAIGADAILLIAAVLTPVEVRQLSRFARSLGLETLLEIHDHRELDHICDSVDAVGVNNRNLADFTVDVHRSLELAPHIPDEFVKVSESGLSDPVVVLELRAAGFQGFLIGESFMKMAGPGWACGEFIHRLFA
ncbi:MAG: indole-3-glycerol phosphate synthase TrpC [Bacteroidetes bacterium]|nr:indole-3-glycerol phosphate synthase TrpC [Bacteroidota bacterium]